MFGPLQSELSEVQKLKKKLQISQFGMKRSAFPIVPHSRIVTLQPNQVALVYNWNLFPVVRNRILKTVIWTDRRLKETEKNNGRNKQPQTLYELIPKMISAVSMNVVM